MLEKMNDAIFNKDRSAQKEQTAQHQLKKLQSHGLMGDLLTESLGSS